jgi:hypothetical protein
VDALAPREDNTQTTKQIQAVTAAAAGLGSLRRILFIFILVGLCAKLLRTSKLKSQPFGLLFILAHNLVCSCPLFLQFLQQVGVRALAFAGRGRLGVRVDWWLGVRLDWWFIWIRLNWRATVRLSIRGGVVGAPEAKVDCPGGVSLASGGELPKKNFQRAFLCLGIDCYWDILHHFGCYKFCPGFREGDDFTPIIECGTQQVDKFLLSPKGAIGRELILGGSYREIIMIRRRYSKYLSLGSEDIRMVSQSEYFPKHSSAKYPTWSVTTTRKNFLARDFPLPEGATADRWLWAGEPACARTCVSRSPFVMASCRAWFAASALSVEKGFCLPVAVGLGGRGITTTSSSVGSGVGFASPHRSRIHGGIRPFCDKMFPRYLG